MDSKTAQNYLLLVAAMLFWGGSWVSAKVVVSLAPPMTVGFMRFAVATALFLVALSISGSSLRKLMSRSNFRLFLLTGMTGIFGYGVFFLIGLQFTTAAQGSIIAGFNPAMISFFAYLIHREHLHSRWQYSGFLLSFAGVVFVVGVQALLDFRSDYLLGNVIILCAMVMWGLYSSIGKEAMKTLSPMESTTGAVFVGMILFGLAALFEEPWSLPVLSDPVFWANILFLGVFVTFLGYLFYFRSISYLGATRTGGFINLVPVFGTVLSVVLLGEPIYWTFIVGLVLVVSGITLVNRHAGSPIEGSHEFR
ncbi:MAG: DMT family transporter [Candidatus Thorarchaeota archaeon]